MAICLARRATGPTILTRLVLPPQVQRRHARCIFSGRTNLTRTVTLEELLPLPQALVYDVVARVDLYPEFVSWIRDAEVFRDNNKESLPGTTEHCKCNLLVSFPSSGLSQRVEYAVEMERPVRIKSTAEETELFKQMKYDWAFSTQAAGLKTPGSASPTSAASDLSLSPRSSKIKAKHFTLVKLKFEVTFWNTATLLLWDMFSDQLTTKLTQHFIARAITLDSAAAEANSNPLSSAQRTNQEKIRV
eukprot:gb/GEZN01016300.1/.p1 GENE.gb/GEZN01016300.1/~~gb/GEZN01016300.1/.p1  ORF type:complete len:246 (+),score=24.95 gb/GEZN01016300.1/:71-808(+)